MRKFLEWLFENRLFQLFVLMPFALIFLLIFGNSIEKDIEQNRKDGLYGE